MLPQSRWLPATVSSWLPAPSTFWFPTDPPSSPSIHFGHFQYRALGQGPLLQRNPCLASSVMYGSSQSGLLRCQGKLTGLSVLSRAAAPKATPQLLYVR